MKAYRSTIERHIPVLRQLARALVESHRADLADELVRDALDEALANERNWTSADLDIHLYARLIGANRLRLRAAMDERRSQLSGGGAPGPRENHGAPLGASLGLDGLPINDREALLLVVLARLDYARAADVLGVPLGTLVSRLTRARDLLGDALWSAPSRTGAPAEGPAARASRSAHLRLVKS